MKELYQLVFQDISSEKFNNRTPLIRFSRRIFYFKEIINNCWYRKIKTLIDIPFFRSYDYSIKFYSHLNNNLLKQEIFTNMCAHKCMNSSIQKILENNNTPFFQMNEIRINERNPLPFYNLNNSLLSACKNFDIFKLLLGYCNNKQKYIDHLLALICIKGYDQILEFFITDDEICKMINFNKLHHHLSGMKRDYKSVISKNNC